MKKTKIAIATEKRCRKSGVVSAQYASPKARASAVGSAGIDLVGRMPRVIRRCHFCDGGAVATVACLCRGQTVERQSKSLASRRRDRGLGSADAHATVIRTTTQRRDRDG